MVAPKEEMTAAQMLKQDGLDKIDWDMVREDVLSKMNVLRLLAENPELASEGALEQVYEAVGDGLEHLSEFCASITIAQVGAEEYEATIDEMTTQDHIDDMMDQRRDDRLSEEGMN